MSNLAIILKDSGQLGEAMQMTKKVLDKQKRVLGDEHPYTISAMNNLEAYVKKNDQMEAEAMIEREIFKKRIGIHTAISAQDLASSSQHATKQEPKERQNSMLIKQLLRKLGDG